MVEDRTLKVYIFWTVLIRSFKRYRSRVSTMTLNFDDVISGSDIKFWNLYISEVPKMSNTQKVKIDPKSSSWYLLHGFICQICHELKWHGWNRRKSQSDIKECNCLIKKEKTTAWKTCINSIKIYIFICLVHEYMLCRTTKNMIMLFLFWIDI